MDDQELPPETLHRLHEAFGQVHYAHLLGIRLGRLAHGAATFHMEARRELTQNSNVVHGGAIASLLDTATAFAVMTILEPDETTATNDLTIHYLRPVIHGRVTATARILRAGRRLLTLSADVTDEHNALCATALSSYVRKR